MSGFSRTVPGWETVCRSRGFSLIEVLAATTIMVVAVTALARLFVMSTRANYNAKTTTFATVLAVQKMEQLRGLAWGFDTLGLPISDTTTDTSVVPESSTGGTGLTPSPSGSLQQKTSGYCDFLDANGRSLGGGTTPPAAAAFIRRWSIEPLPTNPSNTIVIQVLVRPFGGRGAAEDVTDARRLPGEARIVSVRTRKAS